MAASQPVQADVRSNAPHGVAPMLSTSRCAVAGHGISGVIVAQMTKPRSRGDTLASTSAALAAAVARSSVRTPGSTYRRERTPNWIEYVCAEDNHQVVIGNENYVVTDDGYHKPTLQNQPAPDLRYFPRAGR